ncbi:hypothetical protein OIU76_007997 [Salix suchowensis]|nr:hypothetical protein OIU76_007997 [Salix suchowensis]
MIPEGCTMPNTSKPRTTAKSKVFLVKLETLKKRPEKTQVVELTILQGQELARHLDLEGLHLKGMVGSDDSVGEGAPTPGVGNNGSISGEKVG